MALALLVGGGVAAWRLAPDAATTAVGPDVTPSVLATQSTAAPTNRASADPSPGSSTPRASTRPTTGTSAKGAAAQKAVAGCQAAVRAADQVLRASRTGVQHWATHVQAQTDANASKITVTEMEGEFKQTRLAGPADQKRYADALAAYDKADGSCAKVDGATKSVAATLTRCRARDKAQQPVLNAAEPAMKDWKKHLAAMQRSREGHVKNAQGVWIKAWRAAPPNIKAYQKAAAAFDAPTC